VSEDEYRTTGGKCGCGYALVSKWGAAPRCINCMCHPGLCVCKRPAAPNAAKEASGE
jgi:hypothetical protein